MFVSVNRQARDEIVPLAKSLSDLGMKLYATPGTARDIERLGIDVERVNPLCEDDGIIKLLESGKLSYAALTGTGEKAEVQDYIRLHRRALQLGIAVLTSLDTAAALASIIASRFNQNNTELVDINHLRATRQKLKFWKMQGTATTASYWITATAASPAPNRWRFALRTGTSASAERAWCSLSNLARPTRRSACSTRTAARAAWPATSSAALASFSMTWALWKKERLSIETASGCPDN